MELADDLNERRRVEPPKIKRPSQCAAGWCKRALPGTSFYKGWGSPAALQRVPQGSLQGVALPWTPIIQTDSESSTGKRKKRGTHALDRVAQGIIHPRHGKGKKKVTPSSTPCRPNSTAHVPNTDYSLDSCHYEPCQHESLKA